MSCCGGKCHGPEFDADREGICQSDIDRFGGEELTCPECGADVYHDAALCGVCGHAMTQRDTSGTTKSAKWLPIAGAIVLAGLVFALLF